MVLKIVHIADDAAEKQKPPRKLTKKEIFHQKAVEGLERQKMLDKKRAEKMFAPERAELDALIKKRDDLLRQLESMGKK